MIENNETIDFNSKRVSILQRLRLNFIYGLVIILPIFATVWLVLFFVEWITGPATTLIGPGVPQLLSFCSTIVVITMIGLIAKNYIGQFILETVESIVVKVPIVGGIYKSTKQIIAAFSLNKNNNMSPVMIEYPRKGLWALGFVTQDLVNMTTDSGDMFGENKVAVFIPTTPNPTSGNFVYVDNKEVVRLAMSVEQSIKLLMSAGVVNP